MNNAFFWSFETEEDKKPGNWSIEMAIKLKKAEDVPLSWHFEITP